MPEDQPIVVSGGSLKIKSKKKLVDEGNSGGVENYDYPDAGELVGVEIDGTLYPAKANSKVTFITYMP